MDSGKRVTSFRDLEVYQDSYRASAEVMTKVIPKLPESERFDLKDQLSRSSKAIPLEIAFYNKLITTYDRIARQLFRLADAWDKFKVRSCSTTTTPSDHTGSYTHNHDHTQ